MNERTVHDPVHNFISLPDVAWNVIDTPQFQRLRELKQLGTAYLVFPGASHNRFEHSLGVCHLADTLIQRIKTTQPELEISSYEIESLQLAGLCHDLGHGPFSHVFDSSFLPAVLPAHMKWSHEQGSKMMLEYLIDDNHIDIPTDQIKFIQSLIDGEPCLSSDRSFLYQIVANKVNGMDVDKFDYLARDCINVGQLPTSDTSRLMKSSRVIDQDLCYQVKEKFNVYELFHTRYSLFKRVYSHKTCTALNLMLTDAFMLANPYFKFSEAISDPSLYLHLTDHVLRDIEMSKLPGLEPAQSVLKRIKVRELYKFVDEVSIEPEFRQIVFERLTPSYIASYCNNVLPEDVRVAIINLHHGMLDKDPVKHIGFYTKF
ncbi:SAM domain and HD, partial [Coelomomyces lativittatus]